MHKADRFILWFDEINNLDVPLVGGKNASLGEMYQKLTKKGVNIPFGFAVTAHAYRYFLHEEALDAKIRAILKKTNPENARSLAQGGHEVRQALMAAELPPALRIAIIDAYRKLCRKYGSDVDVAVRSSATAEDLPDASFAGQQDTYLNIRGESALLESCKRCFASLFTNRAIHYRIDKGFDHFKVALSIGVQLMVRSDLSCSGVMFSIDTETGFKDVVLVNGIWGLGENIVQGRVNPDEFYIHKPTLMKGFRPILSKNLGDKKLKMVYSNEGSKETTKNIETSFAERSSYIISDEEALKLARWACVIESHYQRPMDMEWAKDGKTRQLFIVQARPETVQSQKDFSVLEEYRIVERKPILVTGKSVGSKIGQGRAQVIRHTADIGQFKDGNILVTEMTDPDWEPVMKKASGIITNRGGRTCHAAIISRELGIPCVVGTSNATEKIKPSQKVTISCAEGETGFVYDGYVRFKVVSHKLGSLKSPLTKVMLNLGNPEQAFESSFIPNDGVGLAREEFIINEYIRIHPKALLHYHELKDQEVKKQIDALTIGFKDKKQFFIEKLAQGVAMIAAAFYPKEVIVRMSDFKSNEYANLIGGHLFEPKEDNPMIGWRGASRYYAKNYKEAFALECIALKKVRDEMGLVNLKIMIPFCRTVEEGKKVMGELGKHGLKRGKNHLEVYVMCEIPSNVILAEQFAELFDGFSIGSNDLTQLTLGLDRDSELVSHIYDERNEAVKVLIASVINKAKSHKRKIGICGEAASIPAFTEFLVQHHIDSVSVAPEAALRTRVTVLNAEEKLRHS
ncbi:phosphoenolpyruvate synthase [Candidatus Woesearchaeota archaeon]|nr:phosphoenolpyruvate synthase [Candidatus Woesearchaeota archaeon]